MYHKKITYPAKLLLFGEYAVISGGEGLAIPDFDFKMSWDHDIRNTSLLNSFLEFLQDHNELNKILDLTTFAEELADHLYLLSNIPEGYGLGSSGAVVAAVYDRYAKDPIHANGKIELNALRNILSQMESFFHGQSSGLDPLVSLLQKPVHLKANGQVEIIETNINMSNHFAVDLYDTNIARHTSTVVATFKEKLKDAEFKNRMESIYLPLVNSCISCTINNNNRSFKELLLKLSAFQLQYFSFAIPLYLQQQWQAGLESEKEIYKLCGAGGGGFMIRFLPKK